ncbi:Putative sensory transduction regulator [Sphingomonas sp. NFR04]|uniref:YbjN domain-containing protein n=1 Tax=Sphingomonas sp. NFR04 TaxID=1566283 RepID=UPI0008F0DAE0|nr:YbjN domain-containing protein [Sphingomonas sp. NFR04]SFJ98171.1 Putative sensory transduction regulator [Sphingomonas sp. NFR04]
MKMGVLVGLGLLATVPAQAQVKSTDPQSVAKALQDAGYKAELSKDSDGDPIIRSGAQGYKFTIFFMSCDKGRNCGDLQFYAGWTDKLSPERANAWTQKHRFARVYSDEKGEAAIEYDLNFEDQPMTTVLFRKNLELWDSLVGSFADYVNESSEASKK